MSSFTTNNNVIGFKNILMVFLFLSLTVLLTSVKAEELKVYSSFGEVTDAHNDKADFGLGHRRLRDGDLMFSENGEVVGRFHSISTVINYNKETNIDTREYLVLVKLPEGTLWIKDVVEMPNKSLPSPNTKLSGVILGGTLGYKGVGGTFDEQLSADGKNNMKVFHIFRGK
jgi:hypothetical protein